MILVFIHLFSTEDPEIRLGKVDYGSMCDQQLLELVVNKAANKDLFLDNDGEYKEMTEWKGVECDKDGRVIKVNWVNQPWHSCNHSFAGGVLMLEWLPPKIQHFNLDSHPLDRNTL